MHFYLVSDQLTYESLKSEIDCQITPLHRRIFFPYWLRSNHNQFLLVESAWQGPKNSWKYHIASYPDYPKRNNNALKKMVALAKKRGIPTIFWNKEDSVHFDRFIDSARWFDHVLTVDENAIPRYKAAMGENASIHTMMFAVQPKFHNFTGFNFKYNQANFVGSYSKHLHSKRLMWQHIFFDAAFRANLGLTIVDRNSQRKSENYRYPTFKNMTIHSETLHRDTAKIYKDYLISLNVNTIEDSPTMFSRRLVEILACGGILISTPALSIDKMFSEFCHVIHNEEEAYELFSRLKHGPSKNDLERAAAGAHYVAQNHTWPRRLKQIARIIRGDKK